MYNQAEIDAIRQSLLKWYDSFSRHLPWRVLEHETPDPYHIWLSEVMLQQTTVAIVIPYFEKFRKLWPTLNDFAEATLEELRVAWQGLGYYSRVRNMHRCAEKVIREYKGNFPGSVPELILLPGIGPYTAAAVAAIAFDKPVVPVDGNVMRVMARLFAEGKTLPASKILLSEYAGYFASSRRPGDFAQALMDLGATVCTPRNPHCTACPLQSYCLAYRQGSPESFPGKEIKRPRPVKYAEAYFFINEHQEIALRRRPEKGILAGLIEVPSSEWKVENPPANWDSICVRHIFTHVDLRTDVLLMNLDIHSLPAECFWVKLDALDQYPLPTLTHKIIKAGLVLRNNNPKARESLQDFS